MASDPSRPTELGSNLDDWFSLIDAEIEDDDTTADAQRMDMLPGSPAAVSPHTIPPEARPQALEAHVDIVDPAFYLDSWMVEKHAQALVHLAETQDLSVDPSILKLGSFYLQEGIPHLHASKTAVAQVTGVQPEHIEPKLSLVASSLLEVDRVNHLQFQEAVANSPLRLVAFLEFASFDETPMKVGQKHSIQVPADPEAQQAETVPAAGAFGGEMPTPGTTSTALPSLPMISKMLALDLQYIMVTQVKAEDRPEGGLQQYIAF